jgi:hypothetical protein
MQAIHINQDHSPVLVVFWRGVATEDEFDVFLDIMSGVLDAQEPHAFVFDASEARPAPLTQQRRMGAWMKINREKIKLYSSGCALVFPSPVFRFALSALFMIQPMPVPYIVCASRMDGLTWAKDQVSATQAAALSAREGIPSSGRRRSRARFG